MNSKIQTLTGTSLAALFVLFAMYGKSAIEALSALPVFIQALSSNLPGGALSGVLSLTVASLFYSFVRRWLRCPNRERKEFFSQLFALCMGLGVTMGQQYFTGRVAPGELLQAALIGLIAGLAAPKLVLLLGSFKTIKPVTTPTP